MNRARNIVTTFLMIVFLVAIMSCSSVRTATPIAEENSETWTFVSIPDFLNFDVEYPEEGWEDALGFILDSMKAEDPDFAMVAGDLVWGHWGTTENEINQWADKYYPGWMKRFEDHGLKVYTAIGDHEIGDNPWKGAKAAAVPFYKNAFVRHLNMPHNGPEHMKGTAFYWHHKNALFVSVDVFEKGQSIQGDIAAQVTGRQLAWLEGVLEKHRDEVDHIIVMGHTPILRPVRRFGSSGILLEKGRDSDLWKTLVKYRVDLYIAGEVHAVTCTESDGIQQIVHGNIIGFTPKPNYMVVTVHKDRLELELKQIDSVNGNGTLWQENWKPGVEGGPADTVTITEAAKQAGFTSIGYLCINKQTPAKSFESATGFFTEEYAPDPSSLKIRGGKAMLKGMQKYDPALLKKKKGAAASKK